MFCQNCGKELDPNASICPNCGKEVASQKSAPVTPQEAQPEQPAQPAQPEQPPMQAAQPNAEMNAQAPVPPPAPQPQQSNTIAIVGFVLSFFVAIAGLICSIIGYKNAKNIYGGANQGLALAGIIISAISMGIVLLTLILVIGIGGCAACATIGAVGTIY